MKSIVDIEDLRMVEIYIHARGKLVVRDRHTELFGEPEAACILYELSV